MVASSLRNHQDCIKFWGWWMEQVLDTLMVAMQAQRGVSILCLQHRLCNTVALDPVPPTALVGLVDWCKYSFSVQLRTTVGESQL
jgi:hypothetical protein